MSKLVHITTMLAGFFCLCVLFFTISIYEVESPIIIEKVEENPQIDIVFQPKVEEKPQKEAVAPRTSSARSESTP